MSGYAATPRCVALPVDEIDVLNLVSSAAGKRKVVPRGAGSNQSGSAVSDDVLLITTGLKGIKVRSTGTVRVMAGTIHANVDAVLSGTGRRLPFDPSSSKFCTVGGNVATKASGLRGLKYGSVARSLIHLRFVCPAFGAVDTRQPPEKLRVAIDALSEMVRASKEVMETIERRRGLKSSVGYDLQSLVDQNSNDAIAMLMCGSAGTLGVITEVEIATIPIAEERRLLLAAFPTLDEALVVVGDIVKRGPSALELVDHNGGEMLRERFPILPKGRAVLMVEFDEDAETAAGSLMLALKQEDHTGILLRDESAQNAAWKVREDMLLASKRKHESEERRMIALVEDVAVPRANLRKFASQMLGIFEREGLETVIYGHVGEGNLHFRPLLPKQDWEQKANELAERCFSLAIELGGTVSGEHGLGRNKSWFLEREVGKQTMRVFAQIKQLFDPSSTMNPDVLSGSRRLDEGFRF
ncbi:MAG TPA: FAD-binding oxidoreductase [Methanomassiliicoccales archaeon]|nr:FAD-binding oxidoreductase [Methanomassiliicoccales archaeon]